MITKQIIPKEQLNACNFSTSEVLRGDWERVYRLCLLKKAERIGKINGNRVRITFRTANNETRTVKAVVQSVNDTMVILTGNYLIPTNAIMNIEF
jgi:DNA mismatch repair protein MutH